MSSSDVAAHSDVERLGVADRAPNHTHQSWEDAVRWLRTQPTQTELVSAAYYDDPLIEAAERYRCSAEFGGVRKLLGADATYQVLDVGAGRGIASYAFARDGHQVTALEPDPSGLVGAGAIRSLAGEARLPIRVVETFSETLPFPDACFDVVFARAVLHHTKDLASACREFLRVLRPGGRLIAVREHVISRADDLPAFLASHPLHWLYGGENAFLLDEYRGALRSAGFRLESVLPPLFSEINFAPLTPATVREEVARRVGCGVEPLARAVGRLLSVDVLWRALLPLMELVDRRPGRLYSFVARRP